MKAIVILIPIAINKEPIQDMEVVLIHQVDRSVIVVNITNLKIKGMSTFKWNILIHNNTCMNAVENCVSKLANAAPLA